MYRVRTASALGGIDGPRNYWKRTIMKNCAQCRQPVPL
jgi:hypothetical protein